MSRSIQLRSPGRFSNRSISAVVAAMFALGLLEGCAVLSPPPPRAAGTGISDAAREAKKKEEDKHEHLSAGDPVPEERSATVEATVCEPSHRGAEPVELPRRERGNPLRGLHAGIVTGGGAISGGAFDGFGIAGIQISGYPAPRPRVDLMFLGLPTRFTWQGSHAGGLENEIDLAADGSARYYLTPDHSPIGVYPLAGFRFWTLFWDYANPIFVDDGGVRFYDGHTQEGLRNDSFHASNFVQVMLETTSSL